MAEGKRIYSNVGNTLIDNNDNPVTSYIYQEATESETLSSTSSLSFSNVSVSEIDSGAGATSPNILVSPKTYDESSYQDDFSITVTIDDSDDATCEIVRDSRVVDNDGNNVVDNNDNEVTSCLYDETISGEKLTVGTNYIYPSDMVNSNESIDTSIGAVDTDSGTYEDNLTIKAYNELQDSGKLYATYKYYAYLLIEDTVKSDILLNIAFGLVNVSDESFANEVIEIVGEVLIKDNATAIEVLDVLAKIVVASNMSGEDVETVLLEALILNEGAGGNEDINIGETLTITDANTSINEALEFNASMTILENIKLSDILKILVGIGIQDTGTIYSFLTQLSLIEVQDEETFLSSLAIYVSELVSDTGISVTLPIVKATLNEGDNVYMSDKINLLTSRLEEKDELKTLLEFIKITEGCGIEDTLHYTDIVNDILVRALVGDELKYEENIDILVNLALKGKVNLVAELIGIGTKYLISEEGVFVDLLSITNRLVLREYPIGETLVKVLGYLFLTDEANSILFIRAVKNLLDIADNSEEKNVDISIAIGFVIEDISNAIVNVDITNKFGAIDIGSATEIINLVANILTIDAGTGKTLLKIMEGCSLMDEGASSDSLPYVQAQLLIDDKSKFFKEALKHISNLILQDVVSTLESVKNLSNIMKILDTSQGKIEVYANGRIVSEETGLAYEGLTLLSYIAPADKGTGIEMIKTMAKLGIIDEAIADTYLSVLPRIYEADKLFSIDDVSELNVATKVLDELSLVSSYLDVSAYLYVNDLGLFDEATISVKNVINTIDSINAVENITSITTLLVYMYSYGLEALSIGAKLDVIDIGLGRMYINLIAGLISLQDNAYAETLLKALTILLLFDDVESATNTIIKTTTAITDNFKAVELLDILATSFIEDEMKYIEMIDKLFSSIDIVDTTTDTEELKILTKTSIRENGWANLELMEIIAEIFTIDKVKGKMFIKALAEIGIKDVGNAYTTILLDIIIMVEEFVKGNTALSTKVGTKVLDKGFLVEFIEILAKLEAIDKMLGKELLFGVHSKLTVLTQATSLLPNINIIAKAKLAETGFLDEATNFLARITAEDYILASEVLHILAEIYLTNEEINALDTVVTRTLSSIGDEGKGQDSNPYIDAEIKQYEHIITFEFLQVMANIKATDKTLYNEILEKFSSIVKVTENGVLACHIVSIFNKVMEEDYIVGQEIINLIVRLVINETDNVLRDIITLIGHISIEDKGFDKVIETLEIMTVVKKYDVGSYKDTLSVIANLLLKDTTTGLELLRVSVALMKYEYLIAHSHISIMPNTSLEEIGQGTEIVTLLANIRILDKMNVVEDMVAVMVELLLKEHLEEAFSIVYVANKLIENDRFDLTGEVITISEKVILQDKIEFLNSILYIVGEIAEADNMSGIDKLILKVYTMILDENEAVKEYLVQNSLIKLYEYDSGIREAFSISVDTGEKDYGVGESLLEIFTASKTFESFSYADFIIFTSNIMAVDEGLGETLLEQHYKAFMTDDLYGNDELAEVVAKLFVSGIGKGLDEYTVRDTLKILDVGQSVEFLASLNKALAYDKSIAIDSLNFLQRLLVADESNYRELLDIVVKAYLDDDGTFDVFYDVIRSALLALHLESYIEMIIALRSYILIEDIILNGEFETVIFLKSYIAIGER